MILTKSQYPILKTKEIEILNHKLNESLDKLLYGALENC